MVKRMLIDATHAEETRVVVVNGTRLEEFDVETSTKRQLKGNIYLAKIVRVEPSLQAAFVDYGGNRHGFLAFSEIHPDYYQIPVADRQALLAEHREVMRQSSTAVAADFGDGDGDDDQPGKAAIVDLPAESHYEDGEVASAEVLPADVAGALAADASESPGEPLPVEVVGGDEGEDVERRRPRSLRSYKIQEVIKRRQIVLVQVVKEERGNKGAALTTYLSLAGRYCVLMPNTARGGGVSRKITNPNDRRRLKAIATDLDIPEGMAVIIRTAGSERTKPEIKRDYEYLLRLWDSVRSLTLKSTAPTLVYEEANLIKRSIRDLYTRDIDEILVDGEDGYRLAKDFMRMLTPSHARRVQLHKDQAMPLLHQFQVEAQMDAMHSPVVQLKSGGYVVINQTEALVAIDVNSGRSTKERHIEETALKTNCEAADEIARQLRLRDLAGLIVIDFIDMEESRNNATVERRLKEAMRLDRARIQLGRISPFGLLELSRQRLRPSLMETSFQPCAHCGGTGVVRSVESASVRMLRLIEEEGIHRRSSEIAVTVHPSIALYILNQKRQALSEIEARYSFRVLLWGDESLIPPAYRMEKTKAETLADAPQAKPVVAEQSMVDIDEIDEADEGDAEDMVEAVKPAAVQPVPSEASADEGDGSRRRRRRRRRRGRREDGGPSAAEETTVKTETPEPAAAGAGESEEGESEEGESEEGESEEGGTAHPEPAIAVDEGGPLPRRRRRGKRGGRRRNRQGETGMTAERGESAEPEEAAPGHEADAAETGATNELAVEPIVAEPPLPDHPLEAAEAAAEPPAKPKRKRSRKKAEQPAVDAAPAAKEPATVSAKPKRTRAPRRKTAPAAQDEPAAESAVEATPPAVEPAPGESAVTTEQPAAIGEPVAPERPAMAEEPVKSEPPAMAEQEAEAAPAPADAAESQPPRKGWWNRLL
jgi:ribonuclease E